MLVGGTDPSGGAGLPADLMSASAMGVHGCPVVSALTVQDSARVLSWSPVDPVFLKAQMRSVVDDGPVPAVKTGMLGSTENALALADFLEECLPDSFFVMDPVIASGAGSILVDGGTLKVVKERLLPLADLVTPNTDEAALLSGIDPVDSVESMSEAARRIMEMGAGAVLVKGGHLSGDPCDVLLTRETTRTFRGTRITRETVHGTGCTLASACASMLLLGFDLEASVEAARSFVEKSITRRMARIHGFLPGRSPGAFPPPAVIDGKSFYSPPAYCAHCGSDMARLPGPEGHLYCRKCGFVHYRNPLPAVALILRRDDSVLLVRRAVPPGMGMLCLPGGFMELEETPLQCGGRELMEETGLRMEDAGLFRIETDSTAYGSILLMALEVREWSGDIRPGDDASEVLWVPLDPLPDLAFRAHDRLLRSMSGG
ncbi:MAG: hypothetical protein AVO35_08255 [Candidatus Aegiribacteria sp. MLS_C]|nr:MAG: hypothetical protein AVO35_08255 [Candidatus Aegiribacteria sp. MLS_C]